MTSSYFKSLDQVAQTRYSEKLTHEGQVLPDPLDENVHMKGNLFSTQSNFWPPVSFIDIYQFLVESESSYTNEEFTAFMKLPCYLLVTSNKVHDIKCYHNLKLNVCILTCFVQEPDSDDFQLPWVSTTMSGEVLNGHCTCMEGFSEACLHVAALLFTLEIASRDGVNAIPSVALGCKQKNISKKVPPSKEKNKDLILKRHVLTPYSGGQIPSDKAFKSFLRVLKDQCPQAPYFTCVSSEEETSSASEGEESNEKDWESLGVIL